MLEGAVGRAANGQFYEVVVEHVLDQILGPDDGDGARLLHRFDVDRERFRGQVNRVLQRMRTGNAGRPVFSETVFQLFEDAWLFASVELGAVTLRSGALLTMLIARPEKYTAETFGDLERIPFEELKRDFEEIVSQSPESAEVAAISTSSGGGAGAGVPGVPGARGDEALKRFAQNFTEKARKGGIDPIFGRHREIRQVVDILARRRKNNPIIVGEPGVGKTALVEGLAVEIANGQVPESLKNVELYGLDLGLLQAGAGVKGEFENRLKAVIQEVKSSPKPIILFIDEAHTLIGAGGAQGGSDAANLLKPALARGELRTIAATTWSEYKKYFEKDAALERRFQPVKVEEPSEEDAIGMLRGIRDLYEQTHNVVIRDDALVQAVKLSQRYISGRLLPDKAVDLLDTASARVKMELHSRPEEIVALEAELAGLEREKSALARDRDQGQPVEPKAITDVEEKIRAVQDQLATFRQRWEDERAAVNALHEARKPGAPANALEDAKAQLAKVRGESPFVHSEVDPDVVAKVVASWTGVPVGKMRSDMLEAILNLEERLRSRVRGQDAALKTVAEAIRIANAGIRNPGTPVGVLLFVGPSGVGKTETAIGLAEALYGGERFMTTINMSEFQEKHTVSRLIGSPPGYVGYGEGGMLTEAVRQRPYSVVLLDECEKADPEVMNLFYQVFDKGVLTDGEGRVVDFKNTVVILTSNLASDQVMKMFDDKTPTADQVATAIRPTLSKHFKPALLGRMTVVPFAPISQEILRDIVRMKLKSLGDRLRTSHRIETDFAQELVELVASRCTEPESGARNVDHTLRGSLMPALARELLQKLTGGPPPEKLSVSVDAEGSWKMDFQGTRGA